MRWQARRHSTCVTTNCARATALHLRRTDAKYGEYTDRGHELWDTKLTFQKSYLARLSYVHRNPVRHRLVPVANQYPWCSASWFERVARPAEVKMIYSFKTDKINVYDAYDVAAEW